MKVLVSACLLEHPVRYDGRDCATKPDDAGRRILARWLAEGRIVPFCPEVAGGLPVPRPAAEIAGGDADAVLAGRARVVTAGGADVTGAFLEGAERALAMCWRHRIRVAVLKEGSPSCGTRAVGDGTFSGQKTAGMGITARLLARHGIVVFSENEIEEADAFLKPS
ncbi:MAG: DUF523 domain-containing protein [Mariprofundaceae bacterium]